MYMIRKSNERGFFDHGWLKSYHTFSFSSYYDPAFMGFGPLRVINEDVIEGGEGFPTHGHKDMEIITYVIEGAVEHKDSTGSSGVIYPYEIQKMSAGKGILHSEFNHLKDKNTHLLQIWIEPKIRNIAPFYEQKDFSKSINNFEPVLLVSPDAREGSLKIHQDVSLWAKKFRRDQSWKKELKPDRKYWIQVVKGHLILNFNGDGVNLSAGDALAISDETLVIIQARKDSEILFFDMTS